MEVRVRDGSAYAGVLHTACVDAGYGARSALPSLSSLPSLLVKARNRWVAPAGFGDHGNAVRDVIQQWVELDGGCSGWCPRSPLHPIDLLAWRVIVVAWSPPDVGFWSASGWIWRRVVEIAGSGSSCVTAMHASFC